MSGTAEDDDGSVTVTGRLEDVVIGNGENVDAAELEELRRLHREQMEIVASLRAAPARSTRPPWRRASSGRQRRP